jgi:hypothetical protein
LDADESAFFRAVEFTFSRPLRRSLRENYSTEPKPVAFDL